MKANEFIKKHGLNKAKVLLSTQGKTIANLKSEYTEDQLKEYQRYIVSGDLMSFVELKRLVESHELVNEFFNLEAIGFDKAIELAKKQIEELEDNETVEFWHRWDDDLSCTVARMKQAIADVESCL